MELNGKNVVYIGGCGGIGFATCQLMVQKKVANLAVLDVVENPGLLKELTSLNMLANVFFLKIDVANKENIIKCLNEVISKMKHIDILINGSGISNEFQAEIPITVNLLGLINSSMIALDLMSKKGRLIVNIASTAGLDPFPLAPVYGATKAGVVSFTRAMADEINYSRHGVSFIAICPGPTTTNFMKIFDTKSPNSKQILKEFDKNKDQTPEECAKNVIEAIETHKNGGVYLSDLGKLSEVNIPIIFSGY